MGKDDLESAITDAVLAYYARYEGDAGKTLLVESVGRAMDLKAGDLSDARKRAQTEHTRIEATIANLLDNLTPGGNAGAIKRQTSRSAPEIAPH